MSPILLVFFLCVVCFFSLMRSRLSAHKLRCRRSSRWLKKRVCSCVQNDARHPSRLSAQIDHNNARRSAPKKNKTRLITFCRFNISRFCAERKNISKTHGGTHAAWRGAMIAARERMTAKTRRFMKRQLSDSGESWRWRARAGAGAHLLSTHSRSPSALETSRAHARSIGKIC